MKRWSGEWGTVRWATVVGASLPEGVSSARLRSSPSRAPQRALQTRKARRRKEGQVTGDRGKQFIPAQIESSSFFHFPARSHLPKSLFASQALA